MGNDGVIMNITLVQVDWYHYTNQLLEHVCKNKNGKMNLGWWIIERQARRQAGKSWKQARKKDSLTIL